MIATRRLYRTVDDNIVGEGDVRAAFLVAAEGDEIPVEYRDAATAYLDGSASEGTGESDGAPSDDDEGDAGAAALPSRRDPVAAWQAYAHIVGVDPDGLTKAQLIDAVEAL